jgi:hypothetical protein
MRREANLHFAWFLSGFVEEGFGFGGEVADGGFDDVVEGAGDFKYDLQIADHFVFERVAKAE